MTSRDPRFRAGLILVTLIAAILRFVKLGEVPVALYCDEALGAYEAWSLLLTGRDMHGRLLPLFFDIFGIGWAEPLYVYLSVPAVAVLGLTNAAARLVAACAGTLCVAATGLMTRALLGRRVPRETAAFAGLAAASLMAVSPWAVHFSRIAFQASLLPLTLAAGFWLVARGAHASGGMRARSGAGSIVAGAAVLGLSLYTYPVSRLALPLLVAGFALLHRQALARRAGALVAAALVLAALAAPIAAFSLTARGQQRFSEVSLTNRADVAAGGAPALMLAAMENYASYFSPGFLLIHGDANPRHSIPGHGMLHPHDLLLAGLGVLVAVWLRSAGSLFLVWWVAASPVAASLTVDAAHAVRSIPILPGIYALAGVGAAAVWSLLRLPATASGRRRRTIFARALLVVFLAASAASTAVYLHDYFILYPIHSGPAWQYGLKEAYDYVESSGKDHDSVYVTRNEDYPWIQMLFHRRVSPADYQATGLAGTRYLFDQEVFYRGTDIPGRRNPIFVLKPWEADPRLAGRHVIHNPDGSEAFVIAW